MELLNGRRKYCELLLHGRRPADSSSCPGRLILRGRCRPAFPRRTPPHALHAAFRLTPVTTNSGPRVPVDSSGFCTDDSSTRPGRLKLPPLPASPLAALALTHRVACSSSIPSSSLWVFGGRSGRCVACCCSSPVSSRPSLPGTCPPRWWGSSRLERRPRHLGPVALRGATVRSSGRAQREVDTRRSKAAGRGRRPPLLDWRGPRARVA
jgi:hypothetical protein